MPLNVASTDLSAVTTGTGAVHPNQGFVNWCLLTVWSAGVTAGQVVLEGSIDGSNWATLATRGFAASSNFADQVVTSLRLVRCRVSTTVVGGTVTAQVAATGPLPNDAS